MKKKLLALVCALVMIFSPTWAAAMLEPVIRV